MFWVLTRCLCFPLWGPSDLELLNEGLSAGKPNTNAADTSCVKHFAQRALIWTFTANTSGEKNLWRFKYKCLSGSSPIGPRKGIIQLFYFNIIFHLSVSLGGHRGGGRTEDNLQESLLCLSCRSQEMNSGHLTWQHVLSHAESSHQANVNILITILQKHKKKKNIW